MREIGGYIEFENYAGTLYHDNAVALNSGRNCLAYLIQAKGIKKMALPYFLCASVRDVCEKYGVQVRYYHIGFDFVPEEISLEQDEWIYIVNYYGQLTSENIARLKEKYVNVIMDYVQAYFEMPAAKTDTLYTCRKFLGVTDGAFLYTDVRINGNLPVDESFPKMTYLLGRYERTATEFYSKYTANEELFQDTDIREMSKLTKNILRSIDYDRVKSIRTRNFNILHKALKSINKLKLIVPEGAFMYPLYLDDGSRLRTLLHKRNIYVPILWPDVFDICAKEALEYRLADNILPLPVDQRYTEEDMEYILSNLENLLRGGR